VAAIAVSGLTLCSGAGATTAHIANRKARRAAALLTGTKPRKRK
jgi:hypothetical protein